MTRENKGGTTPIAHTVPERAVPKPAPAAVQSAHGTYFRVGGMAEIRKEIQARRAEEGTATLELPTQPSRARAERPQRTAPTPAVAEPGTIDSVCAHSSLLKIFPWNVFLPLGMRSCQNTSHTIIQLFSCVFMLPPPFTLVYRDVLWRYCKAAPIPECKGTHPAGTQD